MEYGTEMIVTIFGFIVGWVARVLMATKTWKKIREQAVKELETPDNGINDPEKAVESALVSIERQNIRRQATLLPPMNGSNGQHKKGDS